MMCSHSNRREEGVNLQQLQAIALIRPSVYCGTPSFLRILLEKAAESESGRR